MIVAWHNPMQNPIWRGSGSICSLLLSILSILMFVETYNSDQNLHFITEGTCTLSCCTHWLYNQWHAFSATLICLSRKITWLDDHIGEHYRSLEISLDQVTSEWETCISHQEAMQQDQTNKRQTEHSHLLEKVQLQVAMHVILAINNVPEFLLP